MTTTTFDHTVRSFALNSLWTIHLMRRNLYEILVLSWVVALVSNNHHPKEAKLFISSCLVHCVWTKVWLPSVIVPNAVCCVFPPIAHVIQCIFYLGKIVSHLLCSPAPRKFLQTALKCQNASIPGTTADSRLIFLLSQKKVHSK